MLNLEENELIDWFRIIADLDRVGVTTPELSNGVGIPRSTLWDYKAQNTRPKLEEGMRILCYWSRKCGKKVEDAPRYDLYQPYLGKTLVGATMGATKD